MLVILAVRTLYCAAGERAIRLADTLAGIGMLAFGGALACSASHDR